MSTSPGKNPECGGKRSATDVSKVSAVLLAVSAESGEWCLQEHVVDLPGKITKIRVKLVGRAVFAGALRKELGLTLALQK